MIQVAFSRQGDVFLSVRVSGHAGYARHGQDIVCASVTSALQLVCNGITEVLGVDAAVTQEENLIGITLPPDDALKNEAAAFLQALYLHLTLLEEQFSNHLTTTVLEV